MLAVSSLVSRLRQLVLRRLNYRLSLLTMQDALSRSRKWETRVRTVIDVGASDGRWTKICRRFFPAATYLLIEAQPVHQPALHVLKQRLPRLDYVMAAAGDGVGEIYFDVSAPLGGLASYTPFEKNCLRVPMTTIDHEVERRSLEPPFLIKLDTHGFEVPIFHGAKESLGHTELIVVETYNFPLQPGVLRFHQMCAFLEERGFRCADVCEPLHRPGDDALWQFDLFFIPATKTIFTRNTYV